MHWRRFAAGQQIANGELHFVRRAETALVEIVDVEFDCDELQPIVLWDDDADGHTCILDNLLLHKMNSYCALRSYDELTV
jgi:hypothetical protein